VSDVIDTTCRRNTDGNISNHLALEPGPIGNRLKAGQGLPLRFATQFARGVLERSQILLATRAAPKMKPDWYARKPRQISPHI
jgi:hypothetical protein